MKTFNFNIVLLFFIFSTNTLFAEDTIQISNKFLSIPYSYCGKKLSKPDDFHSVFEKIHNTELNNEFLEYKTNEGICKPLIFIGTGLLIVGAAGTIAGVSQTNFNMWPLIPLGAAITIDLVSLPFVFKSKKHKARAVNIFNSIVKNPEK